MIRVVAAAAAALVVSFSPAAQPPSDSPEPVIRRFVRAMYANDTVTFKRLTLPNARIGVLLPGGSVNQEALRQLDEDPGGLQVILKRRFEYRGLVAKPDTAGKYPVGTTAVYMVAHHRSPLVMVMEKSRDGWRVDPRWWIGMLDLASNNAPRPGTPAYSVRALIAALIAMDRQEALRYVVPGADPDVLFAGAPSQREPSGHLDALAMEMPVVELTPGEFRILPTGGIIEGSSAKNVKILVGLFGAVEIPFVVKLIGTEWKVEPHPYFALINR